MATNEEKFAKLLIYVSAGDREGYYKFLDSIGDNYASLALGVVENSTVSGAIANTYILQQAKIAGKNLTNEDLALIGIDLMRADYETRVTNNQLIGLNVDQIEEYHINTFAKFNLPPTVWTAYTPLKIVGEDNRSALWSSMIGNSLLAASKETLVAIGGGLKSNTLEAINYFLALADAGHIAGTTDLGSNVHGNYRFIYNDAVTIVGGTQYSDNLLGSDGKDVIMTFDGGQNTAYGLGGDDRLYGGFYADSLIGGSGSDVLVGSRGNDILIGGDGTTNGNPGLWDDGVVDYLEGGAGNDSYYISGKSNINPSVPLEARDSDYYKDILSKIDVVRDSDGKGELHISYSYNDQYTNFQYNYGFGDRNLKVDWVKIDDETGSRYEYRTAHSAQILVPFSATDQFGETHSYLIYEDSYPYYEPIFAIEYFVNGDFGINLPGYNNDQRFADLDVDSTGSINDSLIAGTSGDETLEGTEQADIIKGDAGNDTLAGYNGDDIIYGGTGNDSLIGGAGADTYLYNRGDGQDNIWDNGNDNEVDVVVLGAGITPDEVRIAQTDGGHDLTLTFANGAGDSLNLDSDLDQSYSRIEEVRFADGTVWNHATLLAKSMTGTTGNSAMTGTSGNDTIQGTEQADVIQGAAGDDALFGNGGNDIISGGEGNDLLYGNAGDDELAGGSGSDVLDGGDGNDTVSYADATGNDLTVYVGFAAYLGGEVDTLISIENAIGSAQGDLLIGSDGDNRLEGRDGDDGLFGGAGNDQLFGGAGYDFLAGGSGDDLIDGGDGTNDYASYNTDDGQRPDGSYAGVVVNLQTGIASGGQGSDTIVNIEAVLGSKGDDILIASDRGGDVLGGMEGNDDLRGGTSADSLFGNEGDDRLSGGLGNDNLDGGDGADLLDGGAGADILTGGLGNDVYIFGPASGQDTITDFRAAGASNDLLQFDHAVFADASSALAASTQVGSDVVIVASALDTVTLTNTQLETLTTSDFRIA